MRREFLANVSHELKTPIALIQGYAEGLLEDVNSDPESRKFYCDVIVDEAAKMNNMVKKLLTLNQLEAGNDVVRWSALILRHSCTTICSPQIFLRSRTAFPSIWIRRRRSMSGAMNSRSKKF